MAILTENNLYNIERLVKEIHNTKILKEKKFGLKYHAPFAVFKAVGLTSNERIQPSK